MSRATAGRDRVSSALLVATVVACGGAPSRPAEPPTFGQQLAREDAACTRGDGGACHRAGIMYWRGRGTPPQRELAAARFARACGLKLGAACAAIGASRWPTREGEDGPAPLPVDVAGACAVGHAASCLALEPPQTERAIAIAKTRCESPRPDAEACVALADAMDAHRSHVRAPRAAAAPQPDEVGARPAELAQTWTLPPRPILAYYARGLALADAGCDAHALGACDLAWQIAEQIARLHRRACLSVQGDGNCDAPDADATRTEARARRQNALDCVSGDAFACSQPR